MLQSRSLLRLWQHSFRNPSTLILRNRHVCTSRRILEQSDPNFQNSIFTPLPTLKKPTFKDSPVKPTDSDLWKTNEPPTIKATFDNLTKIENAQLSRTGKYSGRTVRCPKGKLNLALSSLNRIVRENGVREEFMESKERLPPHEARRKLRSKRHRIRFKQGIARLVGIVMRMRKKSF